MTPPRRTKPVSTGPPAALRINTGPIEAIVDAMARLADAKGAFSKAPASLGSKSLTQLLNEGSLAFGVDPKFPQALGIDSILHHVSVFGNSPWEILRNFQFDTPFFTSDYPVAIEVSAQNGTVNRIVPLAPDLAIRIKPDLRLARAAADPTFAKFTSTRRALKRHEVVNINRMIVQCAEDLVFYSLTARQKDGVAGEVLWSYESFRRRLTRLRRPASGTGIVPCLVCPTG